MAFWAALAVTFGLLALFSWWASRLPLKTLRDMREEGLGFHVRFEDGRETSDLQEIIPLLGVMSWTGTIGFLTASVAALFTAVAK